MTKRTLQLPTETPFQTEGTAKALWWGRDQAWGFRGGAGKRAEAVGWSRAAHRDGRSGGNGGLYKSTWGCGLLFCVKWGALAVF